jgi:hypothetical protein
VHSTCVRVQWKWFSILCVLTALGCVFFLLVFLFTSSNRKGRLWKSSNLPVLFRSLDGKIYQATGVEKKGDEMFEFARRTRVRLEEDDDGKARFIQK